MSEKNRIGSGGIEGKLEGAGIFYLFISILGLAACIFFSQDEKIKQIGLSSLCFGIGIGVLVQGIVYLILFRAGAEVIRLLKRLNGLPYGGLISKTFGTEEEPQVEISNLENKNDNLICFKCIHFQSNIGVCTKFHFNVESYPKKFEKKCGGKYLITR